MSFGIGRPSFKVEGAATSAAGSVTVVAASSDANDVRVLLGLIVVVTVSRGIKSAAKKTGRGRQDRVASFGLGRMFLFMRFVLAVTPSCMRKKSGKGGCGRCEEFGCEGKPVGVARSQLFLGDVHSLECRVQLRALPIPTIWVSLVAGRYYGLDGVSPSHRRKLASRY